MAGRISIGQVRVEKIRKVAIDSETVPGQFHGRAHQSRPRQRAEAAVRQRQATNRTRNGDGFVRVLRVLLGEHGWPGRRRSGLAVNEGNRIAFAGSGVNEHESTTAQVACGRVNSGQREGCGDRGIHGISTLLEDGQAHLRGGAGYGHHHAVMALHEAG